MAKEMTLERTHGDTQGDLCKVFIVRFIESRMAVEEAGKGGKGELLFQGRSFSSAGRSGGEWWRGLSNDVNALNASDLYTYSGENGIYYVTYTLQ